MLTRNYGPLLQLEALEERALLSGGTPSLPDLVVHTSSRMEETRVSETGCDYIYDGYGMLSMSDCRSSSVLRDSTVDRYFAQYGNETVAAETGSAATQEQHYRSTTWFEGGNLVRTLNQVHGAQTDQAWSELAYLRHTPGESVARTQRVDHVQRNEQAHTVDHNFRSGVTEEFIGYRNLEQTSAVREVTVVQRDQLEQYWPGHGTLVVTSYREGMVQGEVHEASWNKTYVSGHLVRLVDTYRDEWRTAASSDFSHLVKKPGEIVAENRRVDSVQTSTDLYVVDHNFVNGVTLEFIGNRQLTHASTDYELTTVRKDRLEQAFPGLGRRDVVSYREGTALTEVHEASWMNTYLDGRMVRMVDTYRDMVTATATAELIQLTKRPGQIQATVDMVTSMRGYERLHVVDHDFVTGRIDEHITTRRSEHDATSHDEWQIRWPSWDINGWRPRIVDTPLERLEYYLVA